MLEIALVLCGLGTIALGIFHFVLPLILDLEHSVPVDGAPLRQLAFGPIHYQLRRQDVRGITWVMNHAASYVLVSIGVFDLFHGSWLGTAAGRLLALWIVGWWVVRAVTQFALGRRRIDVAIALVFLIAAAVHVVTFAR